ncbi:transglycosylase domain-containing protein [Lactobacillus psittaci]|uniref:Penicillin-binding protein 1A n=1 Tax=Lactobacillus psittaci DSM 15354 TaxID=1122152 RepID=A0A0R1SBW4_9LACO|nr:penicillin-binding protein 1A [Lactobacillus psittaci DSM 15354]
MRRGKKPAKKKTWVQVFKWISIAVLLILVSGVGLFAYYAKDAPSISQSQLQSGGTSSLYTNDGKFLLSLGSEKRTYVKSNEIPQQLKDAVISVEDKRFYSENLGIDPIRIVGSILSNAKASGIAAGGSSITQQLVKLTVFSTAASQRTLKRKAQEAWLAIKVEHDYTKEQILEFYINKVYMNYGNYGMGTAASYYYGKSLKDLDLAQIALIAGMPNAPVAYDPYTYPKAAKYRRDIVLQAMYANGKITKSQMIAAKNESITNGLKTHQSSSESNLRKIDDPYIKEAISEVKQKGYDPYNDNLKITVNIDQDAQNKLYELANNSSSIPFSSSKMQVGATVVDPTNGHVVAIIGGRNLPSVQLGLDRAVQTGRSTGSTIKPVLDYAPAIEYLNWSTAHYLEDTKYVYPGTNIQLYDWDNSYLGKMTMRYALEQSRNVPAVKTLAKVGLKKAALFARKAGINVDSNSGLSVAIGANASSLQMAGAFGAFSTGGIYHKPQFVSKIETADGVIHSYDSTGTRIMKKSTAYMITDMLKGVLTSGSGTMAKTGLHEAGKTGTVKYSDEELVKYPSYASTPKDSWFVGYTKKYSIGVWTGYDNLSDGTISGQGQYAAQLLYKYMMKYLMQDKTNSNWKKPSTVVKRRIVKNSDPLEVASPGQSNYTTELFVKGHAPSSPYSDSDYDSDDEKVTSSKTYSASSSSDEEDGDGSTNQSSSSQSSSNNNGGNGDDSSTSQNNTNTTDNQNNNNTGNNNTNNTNNNNNH